MLSLKLLLGPIARKCIAQIAWSVMNVTRQRNVVRFIKAVSRIESAPSVFNRSLMTYLIPTQFH